VHNTSIAMKAASGSTLTTEERARLDARQLTMLAASGALVLTPSERGKLDARQLTMLLAGGTFDDLTPSERDKLSPRQLVMLAASGQLELTEKDKARLSPRQLTLLAAKAAAESFAQIGLRKVDALHVACAVAAGFGYFITTDDQVLGKADRISEIEIVDPIEFIKKELP